MEFPRPARHLAGVRYEQEFVAVLRPTAQFPIPPQGEGNKEDVTVIARVPALAPFQVRSFRFQWPADLLASWAFEMEGVILGWFVLVSTGSVLAVGGLR